MPATEAQRSPSLFLWGARTRTARGELSRDRRTPADHRSLLQRRRPETRLCAGDLEIVQGVGSGPAPRRARPPRERRHLRGISHRVPRRRPRLGQEPLHALSTAVLDKSRAGRDCSGSPPGSHRLPPPGSRMQRPIVDFHLDAEGHWAARLNCGHPQHVRHDPPLVERPWVLSAQGRSERIGQPLNCVRCDRMELPDHYVAHRRTRAYTADSMPPALGVEHATGVGVWGRIVVTGGRLRYRVPALGVDTLLSRGDEAIVVPEVAHQVEPSGAAGFHLVLYRAPDGRRGRPEVAPV